jgi:hypothetical protein
MQLVLYADFGVITCDGQLTEFDRDDEAGLFDCGYSGREQTNHTAVCKAQQNH